jgi:hypothetical protein
MTSARVQKCGKELLKGNSWIFSSASVKPRRAQLVFSCESNRANLNDATFKHSSPCAFYNFNVAIVVEKSHNHHPKSKKVHFRRSNEGVF